MEIAKSIAWPIFLISVLTSLVSLIFSISLWVSTIIIALVFIGGTFISYPEERPGGVDNPGGEFQNPMWLVLCLILYICTVVSLTILFPGVKQYGF